MFRRTAAALPLVLLGCAHTATSAPPPQEREVLAFDEGGVGAPAPVEAEAPAARPRLSRTVTLGQDNSELTYLAAPPPPQAAHGGASPVIVQNNVVVNQPPAFGFGYGGYGYGYRGYGYGYRSGGGRSEAWGRSSGRSWGATGFEGPGRTAGPGQTPAVGGNWAPAPSYGPAPMR